MTATMADLCLVFSDCSKASYLSLEIRVVAHCDTALACRGRLANGLRPPPMNGPYALPIAQIVDVMGCKTC